MTTIELIIFDFDGVIVDSEHHSSAAHAQALNKAGIPLGIEEVSAQFTGLDTATMNEILLRDFGKEKLARYHGIIDDVYFDYMQQHLKPMPDLLNFLQLTKLPYCIGSSSCMMRLIANQKITKIDHLFDGKTFSADMVQHPKPATDLFLYASKQMGYEPSKCLVIEDGLHGIKAAFDCGMTAIGFVGGSHCGGSHTQKLLDAGASLVFSEFNELTQIIQGFENGKN